jgi:hypothetical protein
MKFSVFSGLKRDPLLQLCEPKAASGRRNISGEVAVLPGAVLVNPGLSPRRLAW